jgi:Zn-dependent oligopeptidase
VKENTKILEQVLELRAEVNETFDFFLLNKTFITQILQLASLLGYKSFSEYTLTLLCAKKPENVNSFLEKLSSKLRILQSKEMEILLNYKKQEV